MEEKGWHIDRLQFPDALHAMVTAPHEKVVDQYLADLREAVETVKAHPELADKGQAATYGLVAHLPLRGMVRKQVAISLQLPISSMRRKSTFPTVTQLHPAAVTAAQRKRRVSLTKSSAGTSKNNRLKTNKIILECCQNFLGNAPFFVNTLN